MKVRWHLYACTMLSDESVEAAAHRPDLILMDIQLPILESKPLQQLGVAVIETDDPGVIYGVKLAPTPSIWDDA